MRDETLSIINEVPPIEFETNVMNVLIHPHRHRYRLSIGGIFQLLPWLNKKKC